MNIGLIWDSNLLLADWLVCPVTCPMCWTCVGHVFLPPRDCWDRLEHPCDRWMRAKVMKLYYLMRITSSIRWAFCSSLRSKWTFSKTKFLFCYIIPKLVLNITPSYKQLVNCSCRSLCWREGMRESPLICYHCSSTHQQDNKLIMTSYSESIFMVCGVIPSDGRWFGTPSQWNHKRYLLFSLNDVSDWHPTPRVPQKHTKKTKTWFKI